MCYNTQPRTELEARRNLKEVKRMRIGNLGRAICAVAILAAAELVAAEYRLERQGENWVAFADGRRFAVLSPAESADW